MAFNSLSDLDGERAEKREGRVVEEVGAVFSGAEGGAMDDETEEMDAVDGFRSPKPIDSRIGLRIADVDAEDEIAVEPVVLVRGTRVVVDCGDARATDSRRVEPVTVLDGDDEFSESSRMPNSASDECGDGGPSADDAPTLRLVRRLPISEVVDLTAGAGDVVFELRLAMRGILVGVSLDSCDEDIEPYTPLLPVPEVDTDGEPAMVGSCARRRSDESEPLVRPEALAVEEPPALDVLAECVDIRCRDDDVDVVEEGGCMPDCRRLATRCMVLLGNDIWIGGKFTAEGAASFFFFSSVEDNVLPRLRPISTEIRLSLRSSFLTLATASLSLASSPFSSTRLLRLDDLSRDESPRLSVDGRLVVLVLGLSGTSLGGVIGGRAEMMLLPAELEPLCIVWGCG